MPINPDQFEFVEKFVEELIYLLSDKFIEKYKIGSIEKLHLESEAVQHAGGEVLRLKLDLYLVRNDGK